MKKAGTRLIAKEYLLPKAFISTFRSVHKKYSAEKKYFI